MKGDLKQQFGKRVQELREAKNLTQEVLAERIGRSVDTIGAIERGVNSTRIETASNLALALDVRLPDLFELADVTSPPGAQDRARTIKHLVALLDAVDNETIVKLTSLVELGVSLAKRPS